MLSIYNDERKMEEIEMRKGETICYYRARGGEKNVYVTMLYHKDKLRGSIIENHKPHKVVAEQKQVNES